MALSILNNVSALQAENQLSITTAAANKSLQQLSSGSRINSGSDDAAGLAISDGLNANIAALNQSSLNATNAVGSLQTADGALAQVTALLNRSITPRDRSLEHRSQHRTADRNQQRIPGSAHADRQHRHHDQLQRHRSIRFDRLGVHERWYERRNSHNRRNGFRSVHDEPWPQHPRFLPRRPQRSRP